MRPAATPTFGLRQLLLLGGGDYACNLYWQTVSFFILFFYTDVLGLPASTAGAIVAAGAVIDGGANLLMGALAERMRTYRLLIALFALPLSASFILLFRAPGVPPTAAAVLASQAAFRICYAGVNIPYAALSVRITADSRARGRIAGTRMLFGTAAALTVAALIRQLARAPDGRLTLAGGYQVAATGCAVVATLLLLAMLLGLGGDRVRPDPPRPLGWSLIGNLLRNRAFRALAAASGAATIAGAIINASLLYYFADVLGRPSASPGTIAWMSLVGAAAVPGWTWLNGRIGTRALWLGNAAAGTLLLSALGVAPQPGAAAATAWFCGLQIVMAGFFFGFWAMLPDTVEWGEHETGVRLEALAFGVALVVQKLGAALATLLLGAIYQHAGYHSGDQPSVEASAAIRLTLILVPLVAIGLSALAMRTNPLRRGTHAEVAAELAARADQAAVSTKVP